MKTVAAHDLRRMILDDRELALLDAREERRFAESHVFYASCCALSRLEKLAPLLVPRRGARVVTCDRREALQKCSEMSRCTDWHRATRRACSCVSRSWTRRPMVCRIASSYSESPGSNSPAARVRHATSSA